MKPLLLLLLVFSVHSFANNNASELLKGRSLNVSFTIRALNDDVDDVHLFGMGDNDLEVYVGITCLMPEDFFYTTKSIGSFKIPMVRKGEMQHSDGVAKIYYADIEKCDDRGGSLQVYPKGDLDATADGVAVSAQVIKEVLSNGVSRRTVKGEKMDHGYVIYYSTSEFELTMNFTLAE
jgi:hypothetical protein